MAALRTKNKIGANAYGKKIRLLETEQGTFAKHNNGDGYLQLKPRTKSRPMRGLIHSHAGTGTYVTATILERAF